MQKNRLDNLLELLDKEPDDAFLLYAIAIEYESRENDINALEYYQRLLDRHPEYLPAFYQLGLLYSRMGDHKEALNILHQGEDVALAAKNLKTLREIHEAIAMVEDEMD